MAHIYVVFLLLASLGVASSSPFDCASARSFLDKASAPALAHHFASNLHVSMCLVVFRRRDPVVLRGGP